MNKVVMIVTHQQDDGEGDPGRDEQPPSAPRVLFCSAFRSAGPLARPEVRVGETGDANHREATHDAAQELRPQRPDREAEPSSLPAAVRTSQRIAAQG